jgi:hypothetical protein
MNLPLIARMNLANPGLNHHAVRSTKRSLDKSKNKRLRLKKLEDASSRKTGSE